MANGFTMFQQTTDFSDFQSKSWITLSKNLGLSLVAPLAVSLNLIGASLCIAGMFMGWYSADGAFYLLKDCWRGLKYCLSLSMKISFFILKSLYDFLAKCISPLVDILVKVSVGFYLTVLKPLFEFVKSLFNNPRDSLQNQFANHSYRSLGIFSGLTGALIAGICATSASFTGSILLPMTSALGLASSALGLPLAIALCGTIVAAVTVACKYLYDQGQTMQQLPELIEPGSPPNP